MKPNKLKYVTNYGIYPYFKDELKMDISKSPFIVVMFYESLNEITQHSEMDLFLLYWDDDTKRVQARY